MITKKIKATLTQGYDSNLTLRLWLTEQQREEFLLEKGRCDIGIKIVILDGGDEDSPKNRRKRTKEQDKEALKFKKRVEKLNKDIEEFKGE